MEGSNLAMKPATCIAGETEADFFGAGIIVC
jgi:hypothetical protein